LSSQQVRITQSLSNNKLRLLFGFFNTHPLNQASLFRGFALKKPVTFVTGFVELSLQLSNKILDDLTKFYENIVGLENKTDFTVLNTV
jgi:hypothetical protein